MKDLYRGTAYYDSNPTWHEEDSPWKASQIEKIMTRNGLRARSVAEIGCGAGGILQDLHGRLPAETEFHGFDIAPVAIEIARKKEMPRLHFYQEDLLRSESTFDLLLVIDVVEHVPDYLGFLERCRMKAKSQIYHIPLEIHASAVLRGTVAKSRKSVGHIHYFSAESALASLEDTGHKIVDHFYTPGALALASFHPSLKRRLANIPRRAVSLFSTAFSCRMFGGYSLLVLTETK